jgi:(1->4)-alpha-D-glucan 1-alpha-D-glucosylmutase
MPVQGQPAPDRNDEYLLYQTLVGTWPLAADGSEPSPDFVRRIQDYMLKAIREEKRRTRWIKQNNEYEQAMMDFVAGVLDRQQSHEFLQAFARLHNRVHRAGLLSSLSALVLKLGSPGVADVYQGNELWDFSLVDPDNRRPVDFDERARFLTALKRSTPDVRALASSLCDGRLKLFTSWRGLSARRRHAELYTRGEYVGLTVSGARAEQVVAFARLQAPAAAIVAVGRFFTRFAATGPVGERAWTDTRIAVPAALPAGRYRDVLTDAELSIEPETTLPLGSLFTELPAVMLERLS